MSLLALPTQVALVDDTGTIKPEQLAKVAGALNEQVLRDFAPVWHIRASVVATPKLSANMWAIHIKKTLDEPGALGYHTDDHNQPVSYVMLTADWPATCSHELLEMLADPWGNRMHGGRLPLGFEPHYGDFGLKHPSSLVSYLLEACDPPEATSYDVGGVALSDFIMPSWYHAASATGQPFSHAGGCQRPREVAPGGYVSFCVGSHWFQVTHWGSLAVKDLGTFDKAKFGSLREFTDYHARVAKEAGAR